MAAPPHDLFGPDMDNGAEPEASDLLQATDNWRGAYADEMELALIENGNHGPQTDARIGILGDGKIIDFVLVYDENTNPEKEEKRCAFQESCEQLGLEWSESKGRGTFFVKIHAKHDTLLHGAEELLFRMPMERSLLQKDGWSVDCCNSSCVNPKNIPEELIVESYFPTASFSYENRQRFVGWDDEKFFTTAQRSAIVWHILQNDPYGSDQQDNIGIRQLLHDKTFTAAFPLHEGPYEVKEGEAMKTDRQLLYQQWAQSSKWFKKQPFDHIRRYFGVRVAVYFAWLGFYTSWLCFATVIGILAMAYGFTTIPTFLNAPANDICFELNRTDYFMCPLCDRHCDFWYLTDTCQFAQVALIFDNEATVAFAFIMAVWAVLFLEFWKRKHFHLEYKWDILEYEFLEGQVRPEFKRKIRKQIDNTKTKKETSKFWTYNAVRGRKEYIQPTHKWLPKFIIGMSILLTTVLVSLAVVFSVIVYRLATGGTIYSLVSNISGGPSIADIVVSITGAIIQLIIILILNKMYTYLARWLTDLELHRAKTDYRDAYRVKVYLFQFVNYYGSVFYIAFLKGNLSGHPGDYHRIGDVRLDECSSYGCLLELTIQLGIIMIGKQLFNICEELVAACIRYVKKWEKDGSYHQWEKDYHLAEFGKQPLFQEYLDLVIQYGFVTIFAAAFPLAPLFAFIHNLIEIRLNARKFVTVFRRPVAERSQDIGSWYTILSVISKMTVVTNAFLIGFISQFVPFQIYSLGGYGNVDSNGGDTDTSLSGYINWSLSRFPVEVLVDGDSFPAYIDQNLPLYDDDGDRVIGNTDNTTLLYLPWINFTCLLEHDVTMVTTMTVTLNKAPENITSFTEKQFEAFYENETLRHLVFDVERLRDSPRMKDLGSCFLGETTCSFRGLVNVDGSRPLEFWQSIAAQVIFAALFEHLVFIMAGLIAWLVPDVPKSVKYEIQHEKLMALHRVNNGSTENNAT